MASWHYPTQVDHLTATRIHLLRRRRVCNHMTKLMSVQPTFAHVETWGLRLLLSIRVSHQRVWPTLFLVSQNLGHAAELVDGTVAAPGKLRRGDTHPRKACLLVLYNNC